MVASVIAIIIYLNIILRFYFLFWKNVSWGFVNLLILMSVPSQKSKRVAMLMTQNFKKFTKGTKVLMVFTEVLMVLKSILVAKIRNWFFKWLLPFSVCSNARFLGQIRISNVTHLVHNGFSEQPLSIITKCGKNINYYFFFL